MSDQRALSLDDCISATCPWSGKPVAADSLTLYQGKIVGFCNPECRDKFEKAITHFAVNLMETNVGNDNGRSVHI